MSLHSSFKTARSAKGHRNVLKRLERIKKLKTDEKWSEEKDSIYNLPKVRSIKVLAKTKSKDAPEDAAAAAGAAAPAAEATGKKKEKTTKS
ncbi:MAG: small basic protein [Candidatus Omnitrophica bacterium]|nr:small basic protein [Candidatus Omnitrophota bacterium]